jgi:hypothetical protein
MHKKPVFNPKNGVYTEGSLIYLFPLPPSLDGEKLSISNPPSKDEGNGNIKTDI